MDLLSDVLAAVGNLPWSGVILILVLTLVFRRDLPSLMRRVKRIKIPGIELEFHEELDQLRENAAQAAHDVISSPTVHALSATSIGTSSAHADALVVTATATDPQEVAVGLSDHGVIQVEERFEVSRIEAADTVVDRILDQAISDPKVALIRLSIELERELRLLLGSLGFLGDGRSSLPLQTAIETLSKRHSPLPISVFNAMNNFRRVRNLIIHGGDGTRDDVLRAIDSGLIVYRTLQTIPHAKYFVHHPGTEVYADYQAKEMQQGVKAVVIEEVSAGGVMRTRHVLPTQRTHYVKGMRVSWEFSDKAGWGESWYRDPDTAEVKYGWSASIEFVGRNIEDFRSNPA